MMDDKVIRFPAGPQDPDPSSKKAPPAAADLPAGGLSRDQEKALQIVLSGMPFVCVGIQATGSGADFFTAVDGLASALADAQPHLDGVIERALRRKGVL